MNWHRLRWAILITFAMLWTVKEIVIPLVSAAIYSKHYMALVVECDQAMEADWYYRQSPAVPKQSTVVQLLACHEYDKTRKLMLLAGLPEQYLAWLGLRSLEIHQRPAEEFAKQHRFTQR